MKYIKFLFIIIIISAQVCLSQQGWYKLNVPTTEILRDISFINEHFGFVVGYNGAIFKTIDGGITWEKLNFEELLKTKNPSFYSVKFFNDSTVILSCGSLLKSKDKGVNWSFLNFPKNDEIINICDVTKNTCFVFGSKGYIALTTNAGETWKDTFNLNSFHVYYKDYWDCWQDTAFIALRVTPDITNEMAGYHNIITKKADIYENWFSQKMLKFDTLEVRNVVAIGKGKFFVLAKDSLYWSFDEGKSWIRKQREVSKVDKWDYTFKYFAELKGYMAEYWWNGNSHKIFGTSDGGITWIEQYMKDKNVGKLNAFSVVNDSVAYACGWNGTVIKTTNAGRFPTSVEEDIQREIDISPNPSTDFIEISVGAQQTMPLQIRIFDVFGREVNKPLTTSILGEIMFVK